ncbi:MAG: type II secretion system major pseudopilin GspG, partial [Planctomycetota bacterium]
ADGAAWMETVGVRFAAGAGPAAQGEGEESRMMGRRRRSEGFTLIEIMVVVIVLAILAATIIPQFAGTKQEAKVSTARHDITILENALERYYLHMDSYPPTEVGLRSLTEAPSDGERGWRGPYIKELRPDPWGNDYQYRSPGEHGARTFDLWSWGADGAEGGEEFEADITNWLTEE